MGNGSECGGVIEGSSGAAGEVLFALFIYLFNLRGFFLSLLRG